MTRQVRERLRPSSPVTAMEAGLMTGRQANSPALTRGEWGGVRNIFINILDTFDIFDMCYQPSYFSKLF